MLSERGLLNGQKSRKLDLCKHCIFEKHHYVAFCKIVHSTAQLVDYIHSNVLGPSPIPLKGGPQCKMTCIDDYLKIV